MPLKDKIAEQREIERFDAGINDNSFAPLVTSIIPKITPLIWDCVTPNGFAMHEKIFIKTEKIFRYINNSDRR